MGLKTICTEGFPVSSCRCTKVHTLQVVECPPRHLHKGMPFNRAGKPLAGAPVVETCPRCQEARLLQDFRGQLCSFCAEQLDDEIFRSGSE
jgi:hypothetical protein